MIKQSGNYTVPNSHMSKHGSPYLRRAVWMAAQTAVVYDPMFRAFFERKRSQGKNYMTAMGHVAKKMTTVIYAVMRDQIEYTPVIQAA